MIKKTFLLFVAIIITACATTGQTKSISLLEKANSPESGIFTSEKSPEFKTKLSEEPSPDFILASEELSPLKTRIISISARATPLRDVLYVIAESTGLNLVMEKGVNPEIPVTLTLNNISAEDALNTTFASVDYFYSIKNNILTVKAVDTKIFEFGQSSVIQDYTVDVGGDILGGIATGTTGTTSGTTEIRGNVTQKIEADKVSFRLWESIEKAIASLLDISGGAQKIPQGITGPQIQPSFSINRMTGTIVVTSTKKDLEKVENYLTWLKKILNRQVIIEARIVEVQLSEGLKYGIDWSVLDINNLGQISVGTKNFASVISNESPAFQIGVTRRDFTGLLKALQTQGDIRVLSNPRVNIMNSQTALLSVGRNVSFISKVETTTTTAAGALPTISFTVQTSSILSGIIIGIVPYINENGEITMSITPIVSDLVRLEEKTVGSGDFTTRISLPTTDLRELSTTVKVRDGQMVIIGGLIQNRDRLWDNEVPFISHIPIIGHLFKSREKINEKTELIIMLKPTIVTL